MPRLKNIIFYQSSRKIVIFEKKMQNFQALGAPPPDPHNSSPHCEFLPTRFGSFALFIIIVVFAAFALSNFF